MIFLKPQQWRGRDGFGWEREGEKIKLTLDLGGDKSYRNWLACTTRNIAFCQGQKPWQNAESLGKWTFTRSFARSKIPSKSAHRKWSCQGFSSWQMRSWHRPWQIMSARLQAFLTYSSQCRLLQMITLVIFKPCQGNCQGLTPGKMCTNFFKKHFLNV